MYIPNSDISLAVARAHFDFFNRREFDRGVLLNTADARWSSVPTEEQWVGHDGYRQFCQAWATAFPDGRSDVQRMFAAAQLVTVELVGRGTHTGPLKTPVGDLPPTGRSVALRFCYVMEIRDEKIAGVQMYYDVATMMRQLGLIS